MRVNNFENNKLKIIETLSVHPDIEAKYARSRPKAGDVLITLVGSIGQIAIAPDEIEGWNLARAVGLIPTRNIEDAKWIYFALQAPEAQQYMLQRANTTVQTTFNLGDLTKLPIPVPHLSERRTILEVLSSLDDKIELNRRKNETLEAMAQAIFKDWFVDFGPVRRKMQGETNPTAILGGLIDDPAKAGTLATLFPDTLGANGLPESWTQTCIGNLLSDTIGGDWGKSEPDEKHTEEVTIIRGTDFESIRRCELGKVPTRFTTKAKLTRRSLLPGDILIEVSGGSPTVPTGKSLYISASHLDRFDSRVVCASFCRRFRPKRESVGLLLKEHLSRLYTSGGTWEYQNQSTGISNFQTTHFLEAEQIVIPGEAIELAFAKIIEPITSLASSDQNRALAQTRDYLLPKLMSGEIQCGAPG